MARADYFAVQQAIKDLLDSDDTLGDVAVMIEKNLPIVEGPTVLIYLIDRQAPENMQSLSAGQRTRFLLNFSIWCYDMSLDGGAEACQKRDTLVGKVEIALMKQRSLNQTVGASWIEGGSFDSGLNPNGGSHISGAEIRLTADLTSAI